MRPGRIQYIPKSGKEEERKASASVTASSVCIAEEKIIRKERNGKELTLVKIIRGKPITQFHYKVLNYELFLHCELVSIKKLLREKVFFPSWR